jgi:hypothetical protein
MNGFNLESIIIHTVDMASRLICAAVLCASFFVWIAIIATR